MAQVRNNYIDGAWRPAEHCSEGHNPSDTSELIGRFAIASAADVRDAVGAARKAFADALTALDAAAKAGSGAQDAQAAAAYRQVLQQKAGALGEAK